MTKLRVLVVDDEPMNIAVAEAILLNAGYEVAACHNGAEAVAKAVEHGERFDIILMDVNMPVMDGFQATKRLRELDGMDRTLIMFVSGSAATQDEQLAKEAGGDRYFKKPYKRKQLLESIRNSLISKGTHTAAELPPL